MKMTPGYQNLVRSLHGWGVAVFAALTLYLAVVGSAVAADKQDQAAEAFIRGLGDQALVILNDETRSQTDKTEAFSTLVVNNTDIDAIGKFTLGQYRRSASPAELDEFLDLFHKFTENFYRSRLGEYSGEQLEVTGSLVRSAKDVIVMSQLKLGFSEEPLDVNWRLIKSGDDYSIRDLQVVGIWLALEQRSQFTSVIANNGGRFSALLESLRDMVNSGQGFDYNAATANNS